MGGFLSLVHFSAPIDPKFKPNWDAGRAFLKKNKTKIRAALKKEGFIENSERANDVLERYWGYIDELEISVENESEDLTRIYYSPHCIYLIGRDSGENDLYTIVEDLLRVPGLMEEMGFNKVPKKTFYIVLTKNTSSALGLLKRGNKYLAIVDQFVPGDVFITETDTIEKAEALLK